MEPSNLYPEARVDSERADSERADSERDDQEERDLEETLDRERHGSGEYDPEERYGRHDTEPDRSEATPGDEDD